MMKRKIAKGYWYNVLDLENGRVLKKEKNCFQKVVDSYIKEKRNMENWRKVVRNLLFNREQIKSDYSYLQQQVDLRLLGYPTFLDGINYEQDKVIILQDLLINSSYEEGVELIDAYITNIINCWKDGFSDKTFNFTVNNGLNVKGDVILIDFNEIALSKEEVQRCIKAKTYLNSWSISQIKSDIKQYYVQQMARRINPKTLDQNWLQNKYLNLNTEDSI